MSRADVLRERLRFIQAQIAKEHARARQELRPPDVANLSDVARKTKRQIAELREK